MLRSWPRLSQTFILNEILQLERLGARIEIFALARSGEAVVQPEVSAVRAGVTFLDAQGQRARHAHRRLLARHPLRYAGTLLYALSRRRLYGGYTGSGALRAFTLGVRLAGELSGDDHGGFGHIHAHFAHDPALVALLAGRLSRTPFSFTAHARDLYQIPGTALAERARRASAVITCCRANLEHIRNVAGADARVELVYHGVDLERFTPAHERVGNGAPRVVSVGRLVEKKGFDDLLAACAVVARSGRGLRCDIYGEGPERGRLELLRERLGLGGVVRFLGARTQSELVNAYREADLFVLTPRVTGDGDRDGVPNVLLEAMACATPVVSTRVGGVAEVVDGVSNGLLVDARDGDAIAAAITRLLDDRRSREQLGAAAARTAAGFDSRHAARRLAAVFAREGTAP